MLKLAGRRLVNLRIEGDTFVSIKKLKDIIRGLGTHKPLNIKTTAVMAVGREYFEHWVHICAHKDPSDENLICLHFVSDFERTEIKKRVPKPPDELYRKMIDALKDDDLLFKVRVLIATRLPVSGYVNILGLPENKVIGGTRIKLTGAIFEDQEEPKNNFFIEVARKHFVFARTFRVMAFLYDDDTVNQLVAKNVQILKTYLKRR